MAGKRDQTEDLLRVERKLDRLTQLAVVVLLCQPVLLVGSLMPDVTTQVVTYMLLALLALLAVFPNVERKVPLVMRKLGRAFGRLRRHVRTVVPG